MELAPILIPYKDIENVSCKITSAIKGGDRLRVYYEGQYSNGFVYGDASDVVWEIIVKEDTGPGAEEIAAGTSLSYDKATKKMTLTCAYDIDCKVKNASGSVVLTKALSENTAAVLDFSALKPSSFILLLSSAKAPAAVSMRARISTRPIIPEKVPSVFWK